MRMGGCAVNQNQSAHQSIPLLKSNEEQLAKIRRQLEGIFRELQLVQDIIMVCGEVRRSVNSDFDASVERVLRHYGSARLFSQMKTLTEIVERFGGTTAMSGEADEQGPAACSPSTPSRE